LIQIQLEEKEIGKILPIEIGAISIPRSAKKIFEILTQEGPLTSGDLEKRCTYSDRTIRNALKKLMRIGLVRKVANFSDMRTSLFHVEASSAA
jgi:DNA-binding transcriptional regulator GbsR (MarR family)